MAGDGFKLDIQQRLEWLRRISQQILSMRGGLARPPEPPRAESSITSAGQRPSGNTCPMIPEATPACTSARAALLQPAEEASDPLPGSRKRKKKARERTPRFVPGTTRLLSTGSRGHGKGLCRPCCCNTRCVPCPAGRSCAFCHYDQDDHHIRSDSADRSRDGEHGAGTTTILTSYTECRSLEHENRDPGVDVITKLLDYFQG
eukprot:TRINITY_DN14880_c0_g1_i10.p1 TRINITY_DN14880_c0_g1~~TRINITY_DN14880_c0_g1_i10.p1  ORF type:complete len:203 (-),score=17.45 TRINITY_DN14880_c0_g1_i10:95-703(-)